MLHYSGHNMLTHVGFFHTTNLLLSPSAAELNRAALPPTTDMRRRNQIDSSMIQSSPRAGVHFLLLENIIAVES